MRILFPLAEPILAGKARFVAIVNTAAALARAGADVRLIIPGPRDAPRRYAEEQLGIGWPPTLASIGIPGWHKELGHWFTWNRITVAGALRALAREGGAGPAVILVRHEKLALALARQSGPAGLPWVFEAHAVAADYERERGRPERRVAAADERTRAILGRASGLAAISRGLLDELVRRYGFRRPSVVARSGIDLERFPHSWRGTLSHPQGTSDGALGTRAAPTIVYVGRLGAWKGVRSLVVAAAQIPEARLLLVGGGDALEIATIRETARAAGAEGRVEITGRVKNSEVAALLAAADVAVHGLPRDLSIAARDTSPLKLLEYLAVGIPVVAPDLPSVRELLEDGKSAVLVASEDPAVLAAAIRRVLADADLQRRLSEAGLIVARQHTWDQRARTLIGLFDAVVAAPARSAS